MSEAVSHLDRRPWKAVVPEKFATATVTAVTLVLTTLLATASCSRTDAVSADAVSADAVSADADSALPRDRPLIRARHKVDELPFDVVVFETVFWEPRDTDSLRRLIQETPLVRECDVLEIGTGSGLVALCCLHAGAKRVVATDVNPEALANARYNAVMLKLADRLETRQVPLDNRSAFAVLKPGERFDLIVSNPPWEDGQPEAIGEFALYDDGFRLLDSLLRDLPQRLNPDGKLLLAYGHRPAVEQVQRLADKYGLHVRILDDRTVAELPRDFLPGMLLEVTRNSHS